MKNKPKEYYDRNAALYDKLLAPVDGTLTKWRKELLKDVSGKTLEIGIGTGKNIQHYPAGVTLTGIDSSERMLKYAHRRANGYTHIDQLLKMDAEDLIFPDNTFDTVVASCVFCSVSDPIKGFHEIKRVCKENGTILLLEHVRSQKKILGKIMDILNPISYTLYGDNINRKTYDNLILAGFEPSQIETVNIWSDIWQIFHIKNN
ncbi:MAG: class I SAM-dependent methyltransferase [Dysgonamonadaceae bacterium]|jgi:ubiquinone/menaquinone biosynthesis C-methylase UbiE|nr:class I SAM-dependent methyltransferase [Dysgonamonadaceae bacterium]MDD3356556.1 class I SAM-dependent methyltransferase [Dysgonamonadaceae bacterium]HUI33406.1 class I SAM-dependent methyltransferase [Dysgonamonadaceae bacterium]